jgi:integrase/recombinase XerD
MTDFNPKNERLKRDYVRYLKEAKRMSESSVKAVRKALYDFETYTRFADFITFNKEQAIGFKAHLAKRFSLITGKPLSKSTLHSTMNTLKAFYTWLSYQPRFKSRIKLTDCQYFNLTHKDVSVAKSGKYKDFATLEQIRKALFAMPSNTVIERRNRAVFAFTLLTGMRDGAMISLKLKHTDVARKLVKQEPDEVKTKFSKRIETFFFPVGEDVETVVLDWIKELKEIRLYGMNDPVFPQTAKGHDEHANFIATGIEPKHWSTATPIREIFKQAFAAVGIDYFSPHTFRDTLVNMGEQVCQTPEEFKAWSQNLGHEHVLTTFTSYGHVSTHRQGELVRNARGKAQGDIKALLQELRDIKKRLPVADPESPLHNSDS